MNTIRILIASTLVVSTAHLTAMKRTIKDNVSTSSWDASDTPNSWEESTISRDITSSKESTSDYSDSGDSTSEWDKSNSDNFLSDDFLSDEDWDKDSTDSRSDSMLSPLKNRNTTTAFAQIWEHILSALERNQPEHVQRLLTNDTKIMALDYAVKTKNIKVLRILLADSTISINEKDRHGSAPLHYAAGKRCIVKKLALDFDNALLADSLTDEALAQKQIIAETLMQKKYTEMVQLLIARTDIQVNAQDKDGMTALYYAKQRGYTDIVNILNALQ